MKILIVEDDTLQAMLAQEGLTLFGHDARIVTHTAKDALQAVQLYEIDLAFVDISLADPTDGIALAEVLQEVYKIPCIFLSGERAKARANRHAARAFLPKPYDIRNLDKSARLIKAIDSGERMKPPTLSFPLEIFL